LFNTLMSILLTGYDNDDVYDDRMTLMMMTKMMMMIIIIIIIIVVVVVVVVVVIERVVYLQDRSDGVMETKLFMRRTLPASFKKYTLVAENSVGIKREDVELVRSEYRTQTQ